MLNLNSTQQQILSTALSLFLSQGIKKTGIEEIAFKSGTTRVTVYRYFTDKKNLVRVAILNYSAIFRQAQTDIDSQKSPGIEEILDLIYLNLASLPSGDFPNLLSELQRVYPDIWQEFHKSRLMAIEGIFNSLFALAAAQDRLRPELDREIIQAFYMTSVVNILENPALISHGMSAADIFRTVKAIFLHGILKEDAR